MHIIPVIDVRHGVVVRAVAGNRENYQPIETPITASSDPVSMALGFRALFPFDAVYVADLGGIEGRGGDASLAARLADALPDAGLWIDSGTATIEDARPLLLLPGLAVVIGSETVRTAKNASGLMAALGSRSILSLDFRADAFLGPSELIEDAGSWPERVIVMTLGRVGGAAGPDLARLETIAVRAGDRRVYAAGGIRDLPDLEAARNAGAYGALVATALHAGTLKAGGLELAAGL